MSARLRLGCLIGAMTVGVAVSPLEAARAGGDAFEFSGDCVVGIFFVPGDGEAVQRFLPTGYTVQADPVTRRAVVIVEGGSCSNVTIDGSPDDPYFFGEILALVGPPGHDPGSVYDFGAPTSSPAVAAKFDGLGLGPLHLLTRGMSVSTPDEPNTTVTADVPWRFSPYSFSIEVPDTSVHNGDPNDRCCAWTEGRRGTVGGRFRLSHDGEPGEVDAAGTGTLQAEPGSPLAQMMGTNSFTGPAFIRRFHFDATVTLFG